MAVYLNFADVVRAACALVSSSTNTAAKRATSIDFTRIRSGHLELSVPDIGFSMPVAKFQIETVKSFIIDFLGSIVAGLDDRQVIEKYIRECWVESEAASSYPTFRIHRENGIILFSITGAKNHSLYGQTFNCIIDDKVER